MSGASVRVEGAAELARALRQIGDKDLKTANRLALKSGAEIVAATARSNAPVRKGKLRSQIRVTASQTGAAVIGNAPYTAAIHWGRKVGNVGRPPGNHPGRNPIRGRSFINDAAEQKAEAVAGIYMTEIMRVFSQIGDGHG